MDVIQLLSLATGSRIGPTVPIGDFRLINGPIPIHIYGDNIVATVEIQGTLATQGDVNISSSDATFTTIENGSFTAKTITALFSQVSHIRAYVSSYTSGTVGVRILK
jgi:hypothetical protein